MNLDDYVALSLGVLGDWRIVAIAIVSLVMLAVLRYVGMVYYRRPRSSRAPAKSGPKKPPAQPRA